MPAPGQRIWRKDKIGTAGLIYGQPNRIHFEIVAAQDQIAHFFGRATGPLTTTANGRVDAIYGDAYVKLPVGTPFHTEVLFRDPQHQQRPVTGQVNAALAHTSTEELFVGLHYESGNCTITTYREDGSVVGTFAEPGQVEYGLYKLATDRFPACPSAGYELLRFGRVIGPDALNPANAAHWRQVPFGAGTTGWVNLNAQGLFKFSDADLPHWRGWQLMDDDADGDVRCNSAAMGALLEAQMPGTQLNAPTTVNAALRTPEVQEKIKRLVCKFPTEWDDTDAQIDARYGWVRELPEPDRLVGEDYDKFKAFIKKLGFWSAASARLAELPENHWHFSPREFIGLFRACGWLTTAEFKQMIPNFALRYWRGGNPPQTRHYWEGIPFQEPKAQRIRQQMPFLNLMLRKTGINTAVRMAGFFGNAIQETGWLAGLEEFGAGNNWYGPWIGRGFLQLTHPDNYIDYWRWLGRTVPETLRTALVAAKAVAYNSNPRTNAALRDTNFPELTAQMVRWRQNVGEAALAEAANSAGWYWLQCKMARYADEEHALERVAVQATIGGANGHLEARCYYRSPAFWRCSASVNLPARINNLWHAGLNGFEDRCCAYAQALAVAGEPLFPTTQNAVTRESPEFITPRRD